MSRKFGWHSGTVHAKDGKFTGDVYIQDDLVFSDVSAGTLGVTGGIDMTGTNSAIGINFTGGSFSTGAVMCGTGTSARQTMSEAEDFVIGIYTTCADTDGTNTAKPLYVNAQYSGAGQVARAGEFVLYPTAKLGGWCNALKAYTNFEGDNDGGSTGLSSAFCAEMKLPNGASNGAFYPLEIEWVGQASTAFGKPGTGSQSGFIYLAATGTVTDFDDDGVFMSINGLNAGATHILSTNSQSLKVDLDNGTTRYLVLSTTEDVISLTGTDVFTFTTSGGKLSAAATSTTLYGGNTTGDSLVLQGSSADANQKITILGATGTTITGALKCDGTITLDDDGTIADASNVTTITQNTITLAGSTKINLDGPTDVTGAVVLDSAETTGLTFSGATYTTGISMPGGKSYNPIHIGVKSNDADAGLILTGVVDDTGGVMIFCDDGNDTLANVTSPIWTRYLITKDQGTGGPTATGGFFQTKTLTGLTFTTGSYTALKAYMQVGGTLVTDSASTEVSIINAGITFEGDYTCTSGTLSGVDININDGTNTIGTHTGLIIRKTSSSTAGWTTGISIADAGAVTGISIGTTTTGMTIAACTTGISITTVTTGISVIGTGATASAKAVSTSGFTLNNGNLTDGYGIVECDLTLTGTVAGHVSALSSWVNMATVTTGSNYVCAQSNGLWSDTGGILTNGVFIFGMRAQCLLQTNGGVSGAKFYPFSVVNNTNVTTALFKCNAGSSDMGTTAVSKTTEGKYVPLYEDDAGVHYVLIYN